MSGKPELPRTRGVEIFCSHGISDDEWSEWRNSHCSVGASTAPALLGVNPYQGAYTAVKLLRGDMKHPDLSGKWAVHLGKRLEPYILKAVVENKRPDWDLLTGSYTFKHPVDGWATATPDAFIRTPGEIDIPVEVKSGSDRRPWEWYAATGDITTVQDSSLITYWAQVQHQLWITGAPYGYLVGAIGRDLHLRLLEGWPLESEVSSMYVFEIKRDEEWIKAAREKLYHAWFRCVNGDHEPDATRKDFAALAECARAKTERLVDGQDYRSLIIEYQEVGEEKKAVTARHSDLSARIKQAIGEHYGMEVEPGYVINHKPYGDAGKRRLTFPRRKLEKE